MGIRNIYRDLYADIRKKKYFIAFTVSVFFLSAASSIFTFPELRKIVLKVLDAVRRMSQDNINRTLLSLIAKIFAHNAVALFIEKKAVGSGHGNSVLTEKYCLLQS